MADDRARDRLRRFPGVRTVSRRIQPGEPARFELSYVRQGTPGATPLLIIPGGPGLAAVLPYRGVRQLAAEAGFDVVMVEHRGVGLSRTDPAGADLPMSAMTIEAVVADLVTVLDDCDIQRAVVYGSSYGGYLAQVFGAWHPERVHAMVLDSTSAVAADDVEVRDYLRRLFWYGSEPDTATLAEKLRALVADGLVSAEDTGAVVPTVYEFGGAPLLERLLDAVRAGRDRPWRWVAGLGARELDGGHPNFMEFDLAGAIYYRELRAVDPDGGPLDPQLQYARRADRFPAFVGEPVDLLAAYPNFDWPTVVLSGARDMRSARPSARKLAARLPDGLLVGFANSAHSFLDFHPNAAILAARSTANGCHHRLPALTDRIERMRKPVRSRLFTPMLTGWLLAEHGLAAVNPG
ncbi:alpha/beta hydrolase family protein [Tamaricihabitans halophyticus]|uniref:Alpha/beta hydrolase family protein n=1 Tax=Tamaricihabitans halophyticus TaxID=1262583 RepID=A0A4R2QCS9_9PSEU|nr:alpha/beta fold hydrolase [Tamaricihabitans halophyticus]TCP46832.1 alpha/beta hydrolase family protein [Tamaricihabitans halophyticus]